MKFSAVLAFSLLFFSSSFFLCFSFYKAISSIWTFGPKNYFWDWQPSNRPPKINVWIPLLYTLIIVFSSVLLVNYTSLRLSKYLVGLREKYQRICVRLLKILSIFPSFILSFVLFESIIPAFTAIFGPSSSYSLIWVFLSFFSTLFPATSLTYLNWLNSPELKQLNSALLSLGIPIQKREKLYLKASKGIIYLCWANTLIRALGESISLSWFLSSDRYDKPFSSFSAFISSQAHTISSLISSFYFSEGGGKANRESMYVYGLVLLLSSMLINWYLQKKSSNINYRQSYIKSQIIRIKLSLLSFFEKRYFSNKFLYLSRYILSHRNSLKKKYRVNILFRTIKQRVILSLTFTFFLGLILIILFKGIFSIFFNLFSDYSENYSLSGLWVPLWNNLILLYFSLLFSVPISFFAAFFVSALIKAKNIKQILSSFIASIGTAPPMLWAMFSSFFFIDSLNLSLGRVSVLAGILSFTLFSMPFLFTRFFSLFERYLKKYSSSLLNLSLDNSYIWFLVLREGRERIRHFIFSALIRLNGESGLLFITMGASPSSRLTLLGHGQTLTTRIFASLYKYEVAKLKSTVYELILFSCLMLFFLQFVFSISLSQAIKVLKKLSKKLYLKGWWIARVLKLCSNSNFLVRIRN